MKEKVENVIAQNEGRRKEDSFLEIHCLKISIIRIANCKCEETSRSKVCILDSGSEGIHQGLVF
jgi:hypothetical protein